jgi:ribonuclease HI
MPWREAILRGQKVLARVDATGTFVAEGGRVEIRYKANDGRAYQAGARNLEPLPGSPIYPDDHCAPGAAVAPKEPKGAKAKSSHSGTTIAAVPAGAWTAYTDGACTGNPGPAGSGWIVVAPDGKTREGSSYLGEATNNVAELTAIYLAVRKVPERVPVVVHTDSQYAIGVLSKGWKAKANGELIAEIRKAIVAHGAVRFVYVRGHVGIPLNERADELARRAISTRKNEET